MLKTIALFLIISSFAFGLKGLDLVMPIGHLDTIMGNVCPDVEVGDCETLLSKVNNLRSKNFELGFLCLVFAFMSLAIGVIALYRERKNSVSDLSGVTKLVKEARQNGGS